MGHATAKRSNITYAVKLVRGAYMDEEGKLAEEQGYESMSPVYHVYHAKTMRRESNLCDYLRVQGCSQCECFVCVFY